MLAIPQKSSQKAYKAVPTKDNDVGSISEVPLLDLAATGDRRESTIKPRQAISIGTLSRDTYSSWYFVGHGAVDAVLTFGPVFFFVIAGMCIGLNNKPISTYGNRIKAITLLSPTIFPIVYAAILGKFLRRLGLYKAERGTTIGDLERLIGCQSIFSTLERQYGLRRFDWLGVSILLAWLLSPLGGQSSLRLLSIKPVVISPNNATVQYYPIEMYSNQSALPLKPGSGSASPFFAPFFVSAIQTSRKLIDQPMDIFGNVKIPDFNRLDPVTSTQSEAGWRLIFNETQVKYTSVFGIPIYGIPESGNATFELVTHYWAVNCTNRGAMTLPWDKSSPNGTNFESIKPQSPSFDIIIDEKSNNSSQVSFLYQTRTDANFTRNSIASLGCWAYPMVVQSKVACIDLSCGVRAMRKVDRGSDQIWKNVTHFSIFKAMSDRLPGVDISATQDVDFGSELIERWILNPDLDIGTLKAGWVDLTFLESNIFIHRLQMIFNTFWDSTIGSVVRMGGLTQEQISGMEFLLNDTSPTWKETSLRWNQTKVYINRYEGVAYVCHIKLAVLTMAICVVLLVAANLSMLLGIITRTPDTLGFVSMAALDNPYFKKHASSYRSGLEMARQLRDVKIMIGDVRRDADVGHIALATMDAGPKKLSWSRWYD